MMKLFFSRHFHLYVKQTQVVSDNFKASVVNSEGKKTPLIVDTGNFYTGTVKGRNYKNFNHKLLIQSFFILVA